MLLNRRWLIKILGGIFMFVFIGLGVSMVWQHPATVAFVEKLPMPELLTMDDRSNTDKILVPIEELMRSPLSIKQDDAWLIKKIQSHYLYPPSEKPYNLTSKEEDPSMGQTKYIRKIFKEKRDGFFIECGGLDGETRSNSLYLEKTLGWKGVLIEADPKNFELLQSKNRKAWAVNGCLSKYPYPNRVMFRQGFNIGRISSISTGTVKPGFVEVQCLPIYSILLALNNKTTVDFFSLDVEGDELRVLKTIPWDKVDITTISVEFIHTTEGKFALKKYVLNQGYDFFKEEINDLMFVKKGFKP